MIPAPDKHPAYFQHIMCDIETTGLKPDRNHIIQVCAVRFNLQTQEYDPNCLRFALRLKLPLFVVFAPHNGVVARLRTQTYLG